MLGLQREWMRRHCANEGRQQCLPKPLPGLLGGFHEDIRWQSFSCYITCWTKERHYSYYQCSAQCLDSSLFLSVRMEIRNNPQIRNNPICLKYSIKVFSHETSPEAERFEGRLIPWFDDVIESPCFHSSFLRSWLTNLRMTLAAVPGVTSLPHFTLEAKGDYLFCIFS